MKNYTDYNFYSNEYHGEMNANEFNKIITRASAEVQKNIFFKDITGFEEEVQMATCSVADILNKIQKLEHKKENSISNKILKSENVGGKYSRSYESTDAKDIEVEISNQKSKIKEELKCYLLETGLLYRGV